jgi:general stress protein 26
VRCPAQSDRLTFEKKLLVDDAALALRLVGGAYWFADRTVSFRPSLEQAERSTMSNTAADIDHLWTLINDVPVAMVVTHDGQGQHMRGRPMAVRPARDEGAIYFLTDVDAPKAEEIRRNESICLALADNKSQKYVSISGHADIIDDRERVKKLWSIYDKAFWPDKNDLRIRILRVTPESAEFWEGAGAVVTAVKLVAAMASGERMNLGANEKVGFPQGGRLAD